MSICKILPKLRFLASLFKIQLQIASGPTKVCTEPVNFEIVGTVISIAGIRTITWKSIQNNNRHGFTGYSSAS